MTRSIWRCQNVACCDPSTGHRAVLGVVRTGSLRLSDELLTAIVAGRSDAHIDLQGHALIRCPVCRQQRRWHGIIHLGRMGAVVE